MVTSPHSPKPSEQGMPSASIMPNETKHDFFLEKLNLSINTETTVSIRDMAEVSAAKSTSAKNIVPIIGPAAPMLPKTLGIVINISDGPAFIAASFPPENTNTAGTIIRPASIAIPESKSSMLFTDFSISSSLFM